MKEDKLSEIFIPPSLGRIIVEAKEEVYWKKIKNLILLEGNFEKVSLSELVWWCKMSNDLVKKSGSLAPWIMEQRNLARKETTTRLKNKESEIPELSYGQLFSLLNFVTNHLLKKEFGYKLISKFSTTDQELKRQSWTGDKSLESFCDKVGILALRKLGKEKMDPQRKLVYIKHQKSNFSSKLELKVDKLISELEKINEKNRKSLEEKRLAEERKTYPVCPICKNNNHVEKKYEPIPFTSRTIIGPRQGNRKGKEYFKCTKHKIRIEPD